MSVEKLERVRDEIQAFSKVHQEQVFSMPKEGNAEYQETSQGVLINMGYLTDDVLDRIIQFATYVKEQEVAIKKDEQAKETLRENYFGASA